MLKRALGHRFAALGMLVAEMFKTLIYLDVKIFNISNKNYLGIAWNLYVVKLNLPVVRFIDIIFPVYEN